MRAFWIAVLVFLLVPSWSGEDRLPLLGPDPVVTAQRVALFADAPARRRLGALTYLGGVVLDSPDRAFGGFSAMHVAGDRFTLLSDGGGIVRFRLGRQGEVLEPRFAELPGGPGTGWRKLDRDSETLVVDPRLNRAWVSFERANEIWAYDAALTRAIGRAAPPAMRDWPLNSGSESMLRLRRGGFIAFSEGAPVGRSDAFQAVRFAGDPTQGDMRAFRFGVRFPAGFRATDAVELEDGRILLLARRISMEGFRARLFVVPAGAIRPGATIVPRAIARFEPPALTDNFEAMAVTREGSHTILWIASDDNQTMLQRSLLLKFRLDLPAAR